MIGRVHRIATAMTLFFFTSFLFAAEPKSDVELAVWANEMIVSAYTFKADEIINYEKSLAHYFNAQGWVSYMKALTASKLLDDVKQNNYAVNAVATWPPKVEQQSGGAWRIQMPILVAYVNPQYQQKQHLEVVIQVREAPSGQGVRGFMVESMQTKTTQPICDCKPAAKPVEKKTRQ